MRFGRRRTSTRSRLLLAVESAIARTVASAVPPFRVVSDFSPRATSRRRSRPHRGARARRPPPDAARHHRLGQVARRSPGRSSRCSDRRSSSRRTSRLAAQLAGEFREFFPENRVEYFVSYYDYYQPEAYMPDDRHLHREGLVDQRRDRPSPPLDDRGAAHPPDVIVVASVSCIYGLGSPEEYTGPDPRPRTPASPTTSARSCARLVEHAVRAERPEPRPRQVPGARRHDRGPPRLRGDGGADRAVRRRDRAHHPLRRDDRRDPRRARRARASSRPRTTPPGDEPIRRAIADDRGRARRAPARARGATTSCSRHSACGCAPSTTSRCSPRSALLRGSRTTAAISTAAAPASRRTRCSTTSPKTGCWSSTRAMSASRSCTASTRATARARRSLVEHGFRLPSALDNRPLRFEELEERINQCVFMSATPSPYELDGLDTGRRADRPPDRPRRPRGRRQADEAPDRRPDRRDRAGHRARRAGARHDAHEEDGRGPLGLPPRVGVAGPLSPLERRDPRADRDHPRPSPRRVRRPRRDQPAAGGARPARGLARRDPRRRQGGLPALDDLARSRRWGARRGTSPAG